MQNQFLTEETNETTYMPPAITQTKLASAETKDAQTAQTVHEWLTNIQRKTRRDKMKFWVGFLLFESFCLSEIFGFSLMHYLRVYLSGMAAFTLLILPLLSVEFLGLRFLMRKPEWSAEELTRLGGVQAVGTMIDLVFAPKMPDQRTALYAALTVLLPQMRASDAGLLTAAQRRALHRTLKSGFNRNVNAAVMFRFRLAILKALEQIGDSSAIPVVTALANGKARTANQRALKAAAIECLPLLQNNFGGVEANQTLLRASAPEQAPATLLRPATFTPDAAPKELLRASDALPPLPR